MRRAKRYIPWETEKSRLRAKIVDEQITVMEVEMDDELGMLGCWLSKMRYPKIGNEWLHIKFANGEGEIVRHLCGCSRCFNPCHLVRGSDLDNALDENEFRLFGAMMLESELKEDYSKCGWETAVRFDVVKSRYARDKKCHKLVEIYEYVREVYRKVVESKLVEECEKRKDELRSTILSVVDHITVKRVKR